MGWAKRGEAKARALWRSGVAQCIPLDMEDLLGRLGITVRLCPDLPARGLAVKHRSGALILINRSLSAFQRRFTAAHELGHLIMHPPGLYRALPKRCEAEADGFAGELLVPSWAVEPTWLKDMTMGERVFWVCRRFLVSRQCASVRLAKLGLI